MRRRSFMLAATALGLPCLCPARAAVAAGRPRVVASFSILADMVAQVAGAEVDLRAIAGPNADPHGFQPRPSDADALRSAALVVRNGLGFDGWMDRMIRAAGYRGPVVTATDGIAPRLMAAHAHGHGHGHGAGAGRQVPDPHAWQDPKLGAVYARNIGRGLAALAPAQADRHRQAAEAYALRLEALDGWIREQLARVPEARRIVLTSHDAFGYFGAAYGIRFIAPQGVSTEAEPSAAQVGNLIRQVRAEHISAVFMENMANPATLERLAREAGVRVRGRLYADVLSGADGPAPTYEAMFRHNVGLLVPAMLGEAA